MILIYACWQGIAVNKATQAALQKFAGAVGVSTTGSSKIAIIQTPYSLFVCLFASVLTNFISILFGISGGTHTTARTTTTTSSTHVRSNNAHNALESSGVEFFDAREQVRLGLRTL